MKTVSNILRNIAVATLRVAAISVVLSLVATSCSDDVDFGLSSSGIEGEPTSLSLKVNVSDATKLSRAAADTKIENLWIGIYNAASGERTFGKEYPENKEDAGTHVNQTISGIECKSGNSYIVAVANYSEKDGVDIEDKTEKSLKQLLEEADTWDKFCNLAVSQKEISDGVISVAEPGDELMMSGSYSQSNHEDKELPGKVSAVYIAPGKVSLPGAIHLRRLWAKNTVNVSVDQSSTGDIKMELHDIEVVNVPRLSWIQDRQMADNLKNTTVNAGDAYDPNGGGLNNPNYLTSLRFTPPSEISVKDGKYSFSFWQFENKRTGKADSYETREKEKKTDSGENTGIYTALCPNGIEALDNNATYLKIRASITYLKTNNIKNPDEIEKGDGDDQLPTSPTSRTAEVTYIVHLGYIGNDATDFNCYRNSDYTYNVTVSSVNKILVEAFKNDEKQPGAEGTVTDVTGKIEQLDAHFGVFNIYLTDDEVNSFTFSMRTYVSGAIKEFYYYGETDNNIPEDDSDEYKYYDWIEIVPTGNTNAASANSTKFATYPGYGKTGVYYPHQLSGSGLPGQWFTVYVNEYTYEDRRTGETNYGNESRESIWKSYVNQPNRQAWFNVARKYSADGHSVYYKSKYAMTQSSIQTFYNMSDADCRNAMGIEHINESFGMNIRWLGNDDTSKDDKSKDNGRLNLWSAVGNNTWTTYLDVTSQQQVKAIDNTAQTADEPFDRSAKNYSVVKQNEIKRSELTGVTGYYNGVAKEYYDPQQSSDAQYIDAAYACLNRNRDENGNGIIDEEEVKWYLPAWGEYLQIVLGRNTLGSPLMDYAKQKLYKGSEDGENTRFHFIASDRFIIWAEEGLSLSTFESTSGIYGYAPWQLRCMRKLGTNLRESDSDIEPAYACEIGSGDGGVVKVDHYYGTALREPRYTAVVPMHKSSAQENKVARYGFEIAPRGNVMVGSDTEMSVSESVSSADNYATYVNSVNTASYCSELNKNSGRTGWRIPNQKELVIMLRGGFLKDENVIYMSCTQEHWAYKDVNVGNSIDPLGSTYRVLTVNPKSGYGAIGTAKASVSRVRCVRDLTAAEANKTYEQIRNNQ